MKRRCYFLSCFVLLCAQNLLSQNINGLKIYVSKLYATTLYFHDGYTKYNFGETTCPYKFNSLLGDEKSIALETANEVAEPYTLYVTEGGRKHKFTLVYKERLDDAERDVYFTDLNKVAQLSKSQDNIPPPQTVRTETPPVAKPAAVDSAEGNEMKYTDLVRRANDAFSSNRFDDALKFYTAALGMKPDDIYLNTQVQVIQKKIDAVRIENYNKLQDSSFNSYINAGDKSLSEKLYSASKIAYEEALKIKPGNVIALERLKTVDQNIASESLRAEQQKNEDLFVNYLNLGDAAMMKKSYNAARIAFEEALKIKPNDATATAKLRSLHEMIITDSAEAESKRKEDLYTTYINKADKAFGNQAYDIAKLTYDSALKIKPRDEYAGNQVKKIDNALLELQRQAQKKVEEQKNSALQKEYTDLVNKADQEYNSGLYAEAENDYTKALAVNKNDQYLKNRISQIKKILDEKKLKLKQDSANEEKYVATIRKADNAFATKDYTNARLLYKAALTYKNNDLYSNNKITEIEQALAREAAAKQAVKDSLLKIDEANKKYTNLISAAKNAYESKDYTSAKIKYAEAAQLKPGETEAKNKLMEIDTELARIAEEATRQNKADSLISNGEIALATQLFPLALEEFKQALALNVPDKQYYLQRQISYAGDQLVIVEKQRADEGLKRNFDTAMDAYRQGKKALDYLNYDDALFYFKKLLSIVGNMDSVTLNQSQYNLDNIVKYTRKKVTDIEDYLVRVKTPVEKKDTVRRAAIAYASYAAAIYYPNPKDPQLNYVYKKYPDINFNSSPPEQRFDSLLNYNVENNLISREIMSLRPELELTDSIGGVKLICQNIEFKHSRVYFKFLVQNFNTDEFLTGTMLLTYNPGSKKAVSVYPNYVANYPIILSGRQKVIVYVTKPLIVSDNEKLSFEMIDRLNKKKLSVVIPGSIYNAEQKNRITLN